MVNVSILVLKNAVAASIADASYVFTIVNEQMERMEKEPVFEVKLISLFDEVKLDHDSFHITPDAMLHDIHYTDLVIIPSMRGDAVASTYLNKGYAPWISKQYKNGAEVASLCTGAFLLAFTGLLKNRKCTTHWAYANEFRYFYPNVNLVDEKVITHEHGLCSSGGNNAYWNLLLYLVEKYTNREMAIHTAKFFVIDLDRRDQSPFIIFQGQKNHGDETIIGAQEFIETNYAEKFTVDQIAEMFNMSRQTFERRFKNLPGIQWWNIFSRSRSKRQKSISRSGENRLKK